MVCLNHGIIQPWKVYLEQNFWNQLTIKLARIGCWSSYIMEDQYNSINKKILGGSTILKNFFMLFSTPRCPYSPPDISNICDFGVRITLLETESQIHDKFQLNHSYPFVLTSDDILKAYFYPVFKIQSARSKAVRFI